MVVLDSMEITGFVAISNGEKCPYCDSIQGKDFDDSLEHFKTEHPKEFAKSLGF